ncbi:MAG: hypothetical protein COU90_02810 [Candidatus Ryanbacteria bacterium CG10_big_fil_rev_8_21_14_0_10_43_42]|uniref:Uncharacterized protein n=1 Tax=Candidatus Ryanbacteria bacterium CG10_big_fil_rev_8_21_14_0_10_43_42 TaxID=1974864 RepID=A0A2M8KWP7_9BACT|nr:MAG: hypothetical protein COU90_02810 [Candidatus Ryanbacteria bacterium CG10_big_fil_rev_8_21_14_0_10_43_42]
MENNLSDLLQRVVEECSQDMADANQRHKERQDKRVCFVYTNWSVDRANGIEVVIASVGMIINGVRYEGMATSFDAVRPVRDVLIESILLAAFKSDIIAGENIPSFKSCFQSGVVTLFVEDDSFSVEVSDERDDLASMEVARRYIASRLPS